MTKPALIVVDMQNCFLHPKGENFYPAAPHVIEPVKQLIARARWESAIIVHVADRHRDGFHDDEQPRLPVHCVRGGFDADFHEGFGPNGETREITIEKRRYSAFFATDLAMFLREQGARRLIVCGVKTNVCVQATVQDAFAHGFSVALPREATNSNRQHLADAALENMGRYFADVVRLDTAEEMFS